jgi:hypothetical protein
MKGTSRLNRPRLTKKETPISLLLVKFRTCIHTAYDPETRKMTPMCGQPVVPEVVGKLTFGMRHGFLCRDHEYETHYAARRRTQRDDQ